MRTLLHNDRGSAMVMALFFITALAFTATIIVWVSSSGRRSAHNDYSHVRSFSASDAGSEWAINWIRLERTPPAIVEVDPVTLDQYVVRDTSFTYMAADESYRVEVKHSLGAGGIVQMRHRPGWDASWRDFEYILDSYGNSTTNSETRIEVRAARLYRISY